MPPSDLSQISLAKGVDLHMIASNRRLRRKDGVLKQQASGDLVLLDLKRGSYYALNRVGTRVWELCDGTRGVKQIVSVICDEYGAPVETVEADVVALVRDLVDEKLVDQDS